MSLSNNTVALTALLYAAPALADCDVRVGRVPDGDTFYAPTVRVVSPSTYRVESTRFRLKDVYAPERREEHFQKAKTDLADLIWGRLVEVEILRDRDPYGGLIVNVNLCDGEKRTSVNEEMRRRGWTSYGRGLK